MRLMSLYGRMRIWGACMHGKGDSWSEPGPILTVIFFLGFLKGVLHSGLSEIAFRPIEPTAPPLSPTS